MEIIHTSVLLNETLEWLSPENESFSDNAFMVDSTLGEGGHSFAFLNRYKNLRIIGLDADQKIQARAKERLSCFGDRMNFHLGWFNDFYANYPDNLPKPNLILFDLGISVFHYERSGRGFSFRYDEELDMRLNDSEGKSASDIVNTMREDELANLIFNYSEERYSRRIARAIVENRQLAPITNSKTLAQIIYDCVPAPYRHGGIHPATKTFQALRIAVNAELNRLPEALNSAFDVLEVGGKMGVITFHSLEDRICKHTFKEYSEIKVPKGLPIVITELAPLKLITKNPILPSEEELLNNNRAHSAKLRVAEKQK